MKKSAALSVAAVSLAAASLSACGNDHGSQSTTSSSSSASSGADRMTTQLKGSDGTQVGTATLEFVNGYATVTVEAGPNQVLSPGFHGLQIHSVGACDATGGGSGGNFSSAGDVYQAPDHTGFPASGDLTSLQVRPDGSAKLVTTTSAFTAADLRNNSGTSLVVDQNPGTFNGNGGESGKRIACGVIAAAAATTTSSTTTTTTSVSTVTTTVAVPPPETSTSTVTVTSSTSSTSASTTPTSTAPKTLTTPPGG
jgi:superoxide dismutase, Cu-Zn family